MKPEKPKKAKAAAKRTRTSVKEKLSALFKRKPKASAPKPEPEPPPKKVSPRKKAPETLTPPKLAATPPATTSTKAKRSTPSAAEKPPARKKVAVPPILLEGDAPAAPRQSGPGVRYILGSAEPLRSEGETLELPEAYGTQRLLLVARDPHWLYAHWDLTGEQLRTHNTASRDKHLIVRVFRDQLTGELVVEQHVHPESRNWFLHVGRGGAKYVAQLGYYNRGGAWNTVATSTATFTPPDVLSDDTSVRFETIPIEVPFKKLLELVKGAVAEHRTLVQVIQELRTAGYPELPKVAAGASTVSEWTPEQERALAQIISIDEVRRVWMGSLEITELLRRSLEKEISSQAIAALARGEQAGAVQLGGVFSVSSPFGGAEQRKGFWFNVNAELIIYGATELDASVTIGGRKIQLRRDGTFSFRFALPDGKYDLPVQATSADASDSRQARLEFRRATQYRGDVGKHPQDAKLKAPRAENVA
ncbi:MAG TPA: DUF4912 domain-containing protein [Candidatus Limnocylindria bacterium]|nr:DUF4912 domain-containing protein [Candidatus Limnocylindria bacterium]